MTGISIVKATPIVIFTLLGACAYNKANDNNMMSSYCDDAYNNLYAKYSSDNKSGSDAETVAWASLAAAINYNRKHELDRLNRICS